MKKKTKEKYQKISNNKKDKIMCKDCKKCKYKEKVIDEYGYDIFEEKEIDIDEWWEKEFGTKDPRGSELVEALKLISCDGL